MYMHERCSVMLSIRYNSSWGVTVTPKQCDCSKAKRDQKSRVRARFAVENFHPKRCNSAKLGGCAQLPVDVYIATADAYVGAHSVNTFLRDWRTLVKCRTSTTNLHIYLSGKRAQMRAYTQLAPHETQRTRELAPARMHTRSYAIYWFRSSPKNTQHAHCTHTHTYTQDAGR